MKSVRSGWLDEVVRWTRWLDVLLRWPRLFLRRTNTRRMKWNWRCRCCVVRRIRSRRIRVDKGSRVRVPDGGRASRTIQMSVSLFRTADTGTPLSDAPCLGGGLGSSSGLPESGSGQFAGRACSLFPTSAQSPQHTPSLLGTRGARAPSLTGRRLGCQR